ncbi:DUF4276 family protein [Spirosoma spitsbergense]|uniref:DUF4276 family protein n=1 Tax=Spirosoma spitsbergense TaxID=431554 RepID=UPI000372D6E0|nr:DUF4276 family protein [Spirosoma spitsbergense]
MKQLLILVEGQTEEAFVKEVLNPYLNPYGKHLNPTIINTKIIRGGKNYKGGLTNYGQVRRDLFRLVQQNSLTVTTFFDYYGLPNDFPGVITRDNFPSNQQRVSHIEQSLLDDIGSRNLIPYIQLHEFESLLFTSMEGFQYCCQNPAQLEMFQRIIDEFSNPEDINDGLTTAPSKRILSILPNYEKPFQGCMISLVNRIENTLERCPHFADWMQKLIAC